MNAIFQCGDNAADVDGHASADDGRVVYRTLFSDAAGIGRDFGSALRAGIGDFGACRRSGVRNDSAGYGGMLYCSTNYRYGKPEIGKSA